jgi:fatty-acyl-CoA synthase
VFVVPVAEGPIATIREIRPDASGRTVRFDGRPMTVGRAPDNTLVLRDGRAFDPEGFASFLAAQPDLGAKSAPTYVRVAAELPRTPTHKVLKRTLTSQGPAGHDDPVWSWDGTGYVRG